jgi:hypothetical protein
MSNKPPIPLIKLKDIMPKDPSCMKCAPDLEFENGSCIPLKVLIEMSEAYNKWCDSKGEGNKIELHSSMETLYPDEYKRYLLFEFKNRFDNNHKKWINEQFTKLMSEEAKDNLENKVFRPDGPQGKFDWLSTIDINQVLYQYEDKYNDFKFLGAVPIDFQELDYLPFKTLNFSELEKNGSNRVGVIFNLDPSYKSGSHWVSLFIDLKKCQAYFADSYASPPPDEVKEFMKKIENYFKNKGINNYDIRYNKTQHQRGNSECGVYSINFILRLLKGKTFDHICAKRVTDEQVNKCRNIYFNKVNKK